MLMTVVALLLWAGETGAAPGPPDTGTPARTPVPTPRSSAVGRLEDLEGQRVLHISGSPEDLGRLHGSLLKQPIRTMLAEYIEDYVLDHDEAERTKLIARVRRMRPAIPDWYLKELDSCATAAGVDRDSLLLAQCEGDIQSLWDESGPAERAGSGCSGYVAFGEATPDGRMRAGRNFDYWGISSLRRLCLVTYVTPAQGDGIPFLAVGWTGILGGWTLVNQKGLIVANHLGGGSKTQAVAIPTLILSRVLAQKAATVDEALKLIRTLPRMRGQIVWLAQPGDPKLNRPPRAVAVEYDAERVFVREAVGGVLIVTNTNLVFGEEGGAVREPDYGRYADLKEAIAGLKTREVKRVITCVANAITLHSVELFPEAGEIFVAHGRSPAQDGLYVSYPLKWP